MVFVYLGILTVFILLFVFSAREKISPQEKTSVLQVPFQKMASYLLRLCSRGRKKNWKREAYQRRIGTKLKVLHPSGDIALQVRDFQAARLGSALTCIFLGDLLCLCVWYSVHMHSLLDEEGSILRNPYGQGEVSVTLSAQIEGEEEREVISHVVGERIFSEEEIEKMYEEAIEFLPEWILGDNLSLDDVRGDLNLPTAVEGYPFQLSWESDNYALIGEDGKVDNGGLKESEIVMLTAHFRYENKIRDYQFYVQVNPVLYTYKELLRKSLEEAVARQEETTRTEEKMRLPMQLRGRQISWQEKTADDSGYFLFLVVAAGCLLYWGKGREVDKKLELRKRQLLLDYPEIVNKLALYMGAGMTLRNAFRKMGEDYKKQQRSEMRYVYEEVLQTCYELQSGKSEVDAYENFGKRCQIQVYVKLGTLLSQNIRKGSNDLTAMLRKEAEEAFVQRKNLAKKLGEEAGTKLLLPMMMMLCVVMIIIMVPAYFSFAG